MFLDPGLLRKTLFLDIETVSAYPSFDEMPLEMQSLWEDKARLLQKGNTNAQITPESNELYSLKAGIYSEFAKIVCISMGFLHFEGNVPHSIRIKSLAGDDERHLLQDFSALLTNHYNDPSQHRLCGHNIREFDIPFICRRMAINRVAFPPILEISGKKPWQTTHILDTLDLWRFGDYKNYTSLRLLAGVMGIPSPKDDIDGSQVGAVYWEESDIDRIVTYCQKDVVTVIQLMLAFSGNDAISASNVEYLNVTVE
jgi:hypothetical protein